MTLSDLSIKRPVFTTMMTMALVVVGLVGILRLGTDLFPETPIPFVAVTVEYRGAGPMEIESRVIKPIEDAVAGISGVSSIQSFSRENYGLVFVEFKLSMSQDRAIQEVRDKVALVQNLPRDAEKPRVSRLDIAAQPVLTYVVNADLSTARLRELLRDELEPALGQIEGVAQVRVVGGDQREIRVDVDLQRAKAAGVAPAQIAERIGMENIDVPAGRFELGPTEITVRTVGQYKTAEELGRLAVGRDAARGTQVLLNEVATITDGVADRRTLARLNGKEAVTVEVVKQPGSNTVEVAKAVKQRMAALGPALGHGFTATLLIDSSTDIEENAKEVWVALVFGGFMAVVIILLFLLDLRGTFISSLALPTSVIGTFFVMYVLGYTLNQLTLLALSLAIGLLIDDAVVVREAITHRLEQGATPAEAASRGTKDVFLAVFATTLSLVAVFVPVAFMPGIVGQFFKQFGLTISAAVLISMFISFTLDPMLSARLSKQRVPGGHFVENPVAGALRRSFEALERGYERLLKWTLGHRWATAGLTVAALVGSVFAARSLGIDFLLPMDRNAFMVQLKLEQSASLAESTARAAEAEAMLRALPDVTDVYAVVGVDPSGLGASGSNTVQMRVLTKKRAARQLTLTAMKDEARARLSTLPATEVAIMDPQIVEGFGDFLPMMICVMGPDFDTLAKEAAHVAEVLRGLKSDKGKPMATDVRVMANPPKPELAVVIDRVRAEDTALTSAALGMQLRLAMNGVVAGKLREGSTETDIVVRLKREDRLNPETLEDTEVFTPRGPRTVGDVARLTTQEAPSVIEHFNRQRRVMVHAAPSAFASLSEVSGALEQALAASPPAPGYSLFYDGQMRLLREQNDAFILVFVLAVAFVYMVLASQFESFKHAFTILVSVPLALVGALLALFVTGWSLTLGAMIGLIMLMGLVTKNAILLVDQTLQNLRVGDDLDTALLKAGPRRLRPILMTSAAMAVGMVPTAVGRGQGFEFRAPMAIAVIGGVITSTFLTLFVVPLLFSVVERLTLTRRRASLPTREPGERSAA
jgi:HAE1 family hydrophobic/amphiphilic exporter-1